MKKNFIIIFLLTIIFFVKLNAQETNTLYYMRLAPQSNQLNPAFQNDCNFYLGFPGLSSSMFDFAPALKVSDILYRIPGNDSTFTFMHSRESQDQFFNKIRRAKNFLTLYSGLGLASFGFRASRLYFSFDIKLKINSGLMVPVDLAKFIIQGNMNEDGTSYVNYDFSNTGVNVNGYLESSFGISYNVFDNLTVGIRPKMYIGLFDLSTSNQDIGISSSDTAIALLSKFNLNGSIPALKVDDLNNDGFVDTFDIVLPDDYALFAKDIMKNRGFGIDLGAVYQFNRYFSFYASVIDLGRIKWNYNPYNFQFTSNFTYKGIPIPDDIMSLSQQNDQQNNQQNDFAQELQDSMINSLKESFRATFTTNPYYTFLPTKLYFGATVSPLKFIDLGILSRSYLKKKNFQQQLTLSAVLKTKRSFNAVISYTFSTTSLDNIGIGFCWRMGPFNSYIVTDKSIVFRGYNSFKTSQFEMPELPVPIPLPANIIAPNSLRINYRFGVNLMFGSKKKKAAKVDKPII